MFKINLKTSFLYCILSIPSIFFAQDYTLVWQDEFNTNTLNTSDWNYDIGNGCPDLCGWGNNELEYYKEENVSINNGVLSLTAKEETSNGFNYTSAKIHTKDKQTFTYGKFEARIKLPKGQGIWPAFWLLFNEPVYGQWPHSGEIDIMEMLGHDPDKVHGTVHYGGNPKGGDFDLPLEDFSDDFHTFSVEWDTNRILWFVDSIQYAGITRWGLDQGFNWPFDHPFYIIMNVAVGGNWPGNPDANTSFPQSMEIDWVRVYQKNVPTDIKDISKNSNIKIVQNPIQNKQLIVEKESNEEYYYKIIDIFGAVVLEKESSAHQFSIDCSSLAAGRYFLKSYSVKTNSTSSFIIPK